MEPSEYLNGQVVTIKVGDSTLVGVITQYEYRFRKQWYLQGLKDSDYDHTITIMLDERSKATIMIKSPDDIQLYKDG